MFAQSAADLPDDSIVATAKTVYIKATGGGWSSTGAQPQRAGYSDAEWIDHLFQSGEATVLRVGNGE